MPTQRVHQRKWPAHKVPAGPNLDQSGTLVRDLLMQHESELDYLNKIFTGQSTGVLDHGSLSGLSDDDHSIYLLLAATRGTQTVASAVTYTGLQTFRDNAYKLTDELDITKALLWSLGGATTGKTLTLISSHTLDRSITFPNASTILAGLAVLQTFTKANIFEPDSDTVGLTVKEYVGATTGPIFRIQDVGSGAGDVFRFVGNGYLFSGAVSDFGAHIGGDLFLWPSVPSGTAFGSGGFHQIHSAATAQHSFTLPNVNGTAMVVAGSNTRTNSALTTAVTPVDATINAAGGAYQINLVVGVGTAGTRTLTVVLGWTDRNSIGQTNNMVVTYSLSSTANAPTNAVYTIDALAGTAITLTPSFPSGATGTYKWRVGASKVV